MEIVIGVVLFVVGAVFGSFAMCQVWRMRAAQEKDIDHKTDAMVRHLREMRKGKKGIARVASDRSICLHCGYRLRWYDNIPVVSWIFLRGRCRKCHAFIGWVEILMEVLVGAAFVAAYFLWPEAVGGSAETWWNWAGFLVFLMMLVGMAMLFVYDAKWGRLPERPLTFCVVCAILFLSLRIWWFLSVAQNLGGNWGSLWGWFGGLAGALVVLPGLYYILYKVSRERLVGSGDFLLAVPIALVLGDWWLAFWCLFLSNVLGCLVMVPMMMRGRKLHETTHISFGPFLVLGFLVVFFAQDFLVGLL